MILIKNSSKSVKVLKAAGSPTLRLLPGCNKVIENDLKPYLKGNEAANAMFKECLTVLKNVEDISAEEKEEAEKAKEKNDMLNKYSRVFPAREAEICESKNVIKEQAETIKALIERVNALEKKRK